MARVFPEKMNAINPDDLRGSLRTIENYIRYMTERMEFANTQTSRAASESGVTNIAVLSMISELSNELSTIISTVNRISGDLSALQERVAALEQA